jgi:hypothetical protein
MQGLTAAMSQQYPTLLLCQRHSYHHKVNSIGSVTVEQARETAAFDTPVCWAIGKQQPQEIQPGIIDIQECAKACAGMAYVTFGMEVVSGACWCTDRVDKSEMTLTASDCNACAQNDVQCEIKRKHRSLIYTITSDVPEIITIYIAPAKRTSSLFNTGRLEQYFSGRFAIRKRPFNAQLTTTDARWYREVCVNNVGKKIFVQIAGAVSHVLKHWPDNSLLVMTADEVGNWGLGKGDRRFGPHGRNKQDGSEGEFPTNETHTHKHIILPKEIFPMFRQYYHYRQIEAFGLEKMRFLPLGSRSEFPDVLGPIVPAPDRTYVYSYMAALTDATRRKVHELLVNDQTRTPIYANL